MHVKDHRLGIEFPKDDTAPRLIWVWASVLGIDADSIEADDGLLRIGGDSIGAMRLVGAARDEGLRLTVADVFSQPRLCRLVKLVEVEGNSIGEEAIAPFLLLKAGLDESDVRARAAALCGINAATA